jgi:large subunit ribosomal protein L34
MPKRTYQPKVRRRQRVHGFRSRMKSPGGRRVIKNRRLKGRRFLAPQRQTSKRMVL